MSLSSSRRYFLSGAATALLAQEASAAPAPSDNVGARLAGLDADVEAISRYLREKVGDLVSVKDFGASGDGASDDTQAFQAAVDVVTSFGNTYTSIFIPPGTYRITDTIRLNKRHIRLFGAGDKSCLLFDPPSTGRTMILVQNSDPSQLINYITLESFGVIASAASSRYAKTGIKLVDASTVLINRINTLDYSWTGGGGRGSTFFHFCGRDTHTLTTNVINADAPVYADINPNSTTYVFDGHSFYANWFYTLKPSNYAITFARGCFPSNWTIESNSNAYGGKGGIYLNNEGVSPALETPSMVRINQFRCESGTGSGGEAGGYGIYMDFGTGNPACANIMIENSSVNDPSCNGYHLKNVSALVAINVNCGFSAGNDAFTCTDVGNAYIISLGIGHAQARLQMNGMRAQTLHKFAGSTEATPSIAFGVFVQAAADTPDASLVYENGVRKWSRSQVLKDGDEMLLPSLAAGGSMMVNVSSDFGAATYSATPRDIFELNATPDWSAKVRLVSDGAGRTTLANVRAGTRRFIVTTHGS